MARIVILTHESDRYTERPYLLHALARHWDAAGHRLLVSAGPHDLPDADLAILHVDQSLVPTAYAQACSRYARVINGRALDIRKRLVSTEQLRPGDDWNGPVIVKTDLNRGGASELRHAQMLQAAGRPADPALQGLAFSKDPYPVLDHIGEVPQAIWHNPGLVVERFLPEREPRGYWMRAWVFLGEQERCTRYLGADPLVKAGDILAREPSTVPDTLREQRARLGFDFGKFDFVIHDGRAVLLDANRTPFAPGNQIDDALVAHNAELARGLDGWLRR